MIRPPEPGDLQAFARAVIALLDVLDIPYAIGGSVAAMEYGEPRLTLDIDLMVDAGRPQLAALVEAIERWDLYITPLEVILESDVPYGKPFNIIDGGTGSRADCYVVRRTGLDPVAMGRRQNRMWDLASGSHAWFLAPEDVILFKLVYYRDGGLVARKHPIDIAKIIAITGADLDTDYLEQWAARLEVLDLWQALCDPGVSAAGS